MTQNKLEKIIVFLFEKVFSDSSKNSFETIILWLSIVGFIVHLALIYLIKLDAITLLGNYKLLTNPISAIYTPFTFILIYEIYLLVLYLPRSFTTALSKQFEIISLILIRRIFGDIPKVDIEVDWFQTQENLNLIYDLAGILILYYLIFLFNKNRKKSIQNAINNKIERFVISKKGISIILLLCFAMMSLNSLYYWLNEIINFSHVENVNTIFYNDFFELLILADVFILLLSFRYTERYIQIIRNTGFVICTILIRLSFGSTGFTNVALIVSSVIFGFLILKIFNLSEQLQD
jgi:hypothetical protein